MKLPALLSLLAFAMPFAATARADVPWLPSAVPPKPATGPALTQGNFLKPEVGQATLDAALKQFPDRASWDTYAAHLRTRIQEGANLAPWPRRTPLNGGCKSLSVKCSAFAQPNSPAGAAERRRA